MKTPIKTIINEMYDDVKLSPDELEQIKSTAIINSEHDKRSTIVNYRITALMCTMILGVGLFFSSPFGGLQKSTKIEGIIEDIIDNHLSYKNLKYSASSLLELSHKFDYLGFALSKSQPISVERYGKLIGARPCFILNIPAAQLRYQKNNQSWSTIFQTRYDKDIYGPIPDIEKQEEPLTKIARGVQVQLWKDQGLLFAVAQVNQ